MIGSLFIVGFLCLALFFAMLACTSRNTERLLWGTVICSVGLGVAAQISGQGYYGFVMMATFLITDLVIYLYFRTQGLLPSRPPKNARLDKIFRIVFCWLAFMAVTGGGFLVFEPGLGLPERIIPGPGVALLHERIWDGDWLLILVPIIAIVGLVCGGFFLVRRERG